MQKLYEITIKGKWHKWAFNFWSNDYIEDWEKDGLEIRHVVNTVPTWVSNMKFTKIWCWLQDKNIVPLE